MDYNDMLTWLQGQITRGHNTQAGQFGDTFGFAKDRYAGDDSFRRAQLAQTGDMFGQDIGLRRDIYRTDDAFRRAQLAQEKDRFDRQLALRKSEQLWEQQFQRQKQQASSPETLWNWKLRAARALSNDPDRVGIVNFLRFF